MARRARRAAGRGEGDFDGVEHWVFEREDELERAERGEGGEIDWGLWGGGGGMGDGEGEGLRWG